MRREADDPHAVLERDREPLASTRRPLRCCASDREPRCITAARCSRQRVEPLVRVQPRNFALAIVAQAVADEQVFVDVGPRRPVGQIGRTVVHGRIQLARNADQSPLRISKVPPSSPTSRSTRNVTRPLPIAREIAPEQRKGLRPIALLRRARGIPQQPDALGNRARPGGFSTNVMLTEDVDRAIFASRHPGARRCLSARGDRLVDRQLHAANSMRGNRIHAQPEVVPRRLFKQTRIDATALDALEHLPPLVLRNRHRLAHRPADIEREPGDLLPRSEREFHRAFEHAVVRIGQLERQRPAREPPDDIDLRLHLSDPDRLQAPGVAADAHGGRSDVLRPRGGRRETDGERDRASDHRDDGTLHGRSPVLAVMFPSNARLARTGSGLRRVFHDQLHGIPAAVVVHGQAIGQVHARRRRRAGPSVEVDGIDRLRTGPRGAARA